LSQIVEKLPAEAMAFLQNEQTLVYKGDFMVEVMDLLLTPMIDRLVSSS